MPDRTTAPDDIPLAGEAEYQESIGKPPLLKSSNSSNDRQRSVILSLARDRVQPEVGYLLFH